MPPPSSLIPRNPLCPLSVRCLLKHAGAASTHHHFLFDFFAMTRLAVLISGCTLCLVCSWALLAIHKQNEARAPLPRAAGARISLGEEPNEVVDESPAEKALRLKASLMARGDTHREALDQDGSPKVPAKKKKRPSVRSVTVDRNNILETVQMDDLRAPPGRLWIPAALSGPINHKDGVDPLFNVLVAYCQLDMKSYHESPWLFAMGPFHQRTSGCLGDPSLTRTYRLSSLKVSACHNT